MLAEKAWKGVWLNWFLWNFFYHPLLSTVCINLTSIGMTVQWTVLQNRQGMEERTGIQSWDRLSFLRGTSLNIITQTMKWKMILEPAAGLTFMCRHDTPPPFGAEVTMILSEDPSFIWEHLKEQYFSQNVVTSPSRLFFGLKAPKQWRQVTW